MAIWQNETKTDKKQEQTSLVSINNKEVEFKQSENNQIFCTSLDIARVFEKRHDNVLAIIKGYLTDEDMQDFNALNFKGVSYKDAKGELRPAYEVSRDGFSFIAMGLTGKQANKWKVSFITAFNQMEQTIKQEIHSPNKHLTEMMSELYKELPQENYVVNITLKDKNQNNKTIFTHHYEVFGKPKDPLASKDKSFFENKLKDFANSSKQDKFKERER